MHNWVYVGVFRVPNFITPLIEVCPKGQTNDINPPMLYAIQSVCYNNHYKSSG